MKIFISWSDGESHAIALALGDWIPSVIQAVETYVSPEDARKGTNWLHDVPKEMNQSSLGILCVVPGNVGASWLNFEAGVLSKSLDVSKVIPLLIDVERSDLENGPLAQYPSAICEKNDMYRILETINGITEKGSLSEERLRNTFEVWWPKLELDVESIRKKEVTEIQDADRPKKAPDTDKPKMTPDTDKPEKIADTDQPEEKPDSDEPEKTADTGKPEKTPEPGKPEKTPDTGKPKKESDTDPPEKKPERTVEAARKSETKKTEDTYKPAKSVSTKPALEEIEIEMLKMLYKPPGFTPTTAATVGYKLDISAQKAREHLDRLERKNYVREHLYVGRAKEYSIARKGKEYLTKHNLL
jgi:DNA-binding MarR family transcriptional regulator